MSSNQHSGPGLGARLAKEYCDKHKNVATATLARMLYKDHSVVYPTLNACHCAVRRIRGEQGKQNRKQASLRSETTKEKRLNIPRSFARPIIPYKLRVSGEGGIMGDIHIPYHDERALDTALNRLVQKKKTDFIILNGDIIDAHTLSKYEKDPRAKHWVEELESLQAFLKILKSEFKEVIFKAGNHEDRYWRFMCRKAPELVGLDALEFENLVGFKDLGVEYIPHYRPIHAGSLNILHGHEYRGGGGVNPARWIFLKTKASAVIGHFHRGSHHVEPDVRGKQMACWSHGCLAGLHPEYAFLNNWDHSFLEMEFDGTKWFKLQLKRIIKGQIT